jgi:hypothetical protein
MRIDSKEGEFKNDLFVAIRAPFAVHFPTFRLQPEFDGVVFGGFYFALTRRISNSRKSFERVVYSYE